jgi:hypothetical protein
MPRERGTTLYMKKDSAHKLKAVERALGVQRSELIDWLMHKVGFIDISSKVASTETIATLEEYFKAFEEGGAGYKDARAMIKNNLKR